MWSACLGACFNAYSRSGLPPSGAVEAHYLQRTKFEGIAERKLRRCQLTEDRNVEISGRDLREVPGAKSRIGWARSPTWHLASA